MAATDTDEQIQNAAATVYAPAGHFPLQASNMRAHVKGLVDRLNQISPWSPLQGYLEDSLHDLRNIEGKRLQSRVKTSSAQRLQARDLILSFVTISNGAETAVDQLESDDNVNFGTFLAEFRKKLFESDDVMMSICCIPPSPIDEVGSMMSTKSKMFGFTPSRIRRKYDAPRAGVILSMNEYWLFELHNLENLLGLTNKENDALMPAEDFISHGPFTHF
ncbi:hypothetical protein H2200_004890 [Cladophialophora chaetospira]|uniref:Uncharacterized protein n=1 Tax=Cladophialophora chaetospira TaxID=386627 RepID=A0AA38XDY0_9EURO|nr:hypothetical protein H2200_004890 [Cladophialophora chaetospira]